MGILSYVAQILWLRHAGERQPEEWSNNQLWVVERQRRVQSAVGERHGQQECRRIEPVQIGGQFRHDSTADLLRHRLLPRRVGRTQTHTQGTHPAVAQCPARVQRGL